MLKGYTEVTISEVLVYIENCEKRGGIIMSDKRYKYYLPDQDNSSREYCVENNSVIIIGANGSGKSRLGEWIEKNRGEDVHRISAQKSLEFGRYITQRSHEEAINFLMYGTQSKCDSHERRWSYDGEKYNSSSGLLKDYEYALSALLAIQRKITDEYLAQCKRQEREGKPHEPVPMMPLDVLKQIWDHIFPQRTIDILDAKVLASFNNKENKKYPGRDMSDGERVVLYLIAQALSIPENKTIIIDEPELHLHSSIMNRLWSIIEQQRNDCLFIYITHDIQFAATHHQAKKIWVREYDGMHWKYEDVGNSDLPEELLLGILGNRRPVLFVEGTANSYDVKLYSIIYDNYCVVPCGSCSNVIAYTDAMCKNRQLSHLECYGVIDRDYRGDEELLKLEEKHVYTIKVAEVENLFIVEEVLEVVKEIMQYPDSSKKIDAVKDFVFNVFENGINQQICEAVVSSLKFQLSRIDISGKEKNDIQNALQAGYEGIDFDEVFDQQSKKMKCVLEDRVYSDALRVLNRKGLSGEIASIMGLNKKDFHDFIIRQFDGSYKEDLKEAFLKYLPAIPMQ